MASTLRVILLMSHRLSDSFPGQNVVLVHMYIHFTDCWQRNISDGGDRKFLPANLYKTGKR